MTVTASYADYPIGAALGPVRLEVTADMAARFASAVASDCPWHRGASPFGGPIAPNTAIEQVMLVTLGDAYRIAEAGGGVVQQRLAVNYRRPATVGETLTISGRTREKSERSGRFRTSFEFTVVGDAGGPVMEGVVTQAHLLGGGGGGRKAGARPAEAPAPPDDPRYPPRTIPMTLEAMRLYAAWPPLATYGRALENQHTNLEEARRLGRPGVIAMGSHLVGYLEDYLLDRFGAAWLTTGELSVAFLGMVLVGDDLVVSTEPDPDEPEGRISLNVSCRTRNGTVAIAGAASAAAP